MVVRMLLSRLRLSLLVLALGSQAWSAPGCERPRAPRSRAGRTSVRNTVPMTRTQADVRPHPGQPRGLQPATAGGRSEEECSLAFHGEGVVLDCSFPECPRGLTAWVAGADRIRLVRRGPQEWSLEPTRHQPPFSPQPHPRLVVDGNKGRLLMAGEEAGDAGEPGGQCRMGGHRFQELGTSGQVVFSGVSLRRSLDHPQTRQ